MSRSSDQGQGHMSKKARLYVLSARGLASTVVSCVTADSAVGHLIAQLINN